MISEIFFDIETKNLFDDVGSFDPAALGVSIVSVYKRQINDNFEEITGELKSFWETDFNQMWDYFSHVDRCIGFNSLHFDVPALNPLCPYDFKKIPHFDIMNKVKDALGFRLGLNAIATETLGHGKSDIGTNAVVYWRENTPESLDKLKKYCEMDVMVTKNVYDHALRHGHLKYKDKWNTPRMFEVDFSYPKTKKPIGEQIGLF